MAIFIACPSCEAQLAEGLLSPCPRCGWAAEPHEKEAMMRESAMNVARIVGELQGSRIRLLIVAFVSIGVNILLTVILIVLLLR